MRYKLPIVLNAALILGSLGAQDFALQPAPAGTPRFKDIGGQVYAQNFIDSYSYASAQVAVTLNSVGQNYLSGNIVASGLKPNFAYQIKLAGRPSKEAVTDAQKAAADDATNEMLGHLGRWWRAQPNPGNSDDGDFNTNNADPNYIFEGYLIIGFFVTDAAGNANIHFVGFNSFHVLWRVDQRPPSINDGPPLPVTVPDTTGNSAYTAAVPARDYQLYGEWQPTRALPGTMQMTAGHYRCDFMLTEESFHDFTTLGGNWSAAMVAPVEFDIPTTPGSAPASPLDISKLEVLLDSDHGSADAAIMTFGLKLPQGLPTGKDALKGLLFKFNFMGVDREFTLDERGHGLSKYGLVIVRPSRGDPTSANVTLRLVHGSFVMPSPTSPQANDTSLSLSVATTDYFGSVKTQSRRGKTLEIIWFRK